MDYMVVEVDVELMMLEVELLMHMEVMEVIMEVVEELGRKSKILILELLEEMVVLMVELGVLLVVEAQMVPIH